MSAAYYNEMDKFAAAWLRELIRADAIAPGDVDERDVRDVLPVDLLGYDQHHFFGGVGTWSYALRQAGWPDSRPIWTGSCPCQPFSAAGRGLGAADERHLWPAFFHLIAQCRPAIVVGEQVASKAGRAWFSTVRADLEGSGYTVGAADLPACGVGAPHIRQRLWWTGKRLADAEHAERRAELQVDSDTYGRDGLGRRGDAGGLVDGIGARLEGYAGHGDRGPQPGRLGTPPDGSIAATGGVGGLADAERSGRIDTGNDQREHVAPGRPERIVALDQRQPGEGCRTQIEELGRPGPADGFWRDVDWLLCRDGKWRPVEPESQPLAHGVTGRVGKLRGYGNALCSPVAQAFIEAVMDGEIDVFA